MSYSPEYFTTRETWRDWRVEAGALIRLARVTQIARVLEIGCGGGGLLRMLSECGAHAVGVDTLETALKVASGKWDVTSEMRGMPLPPVTGHLSRIGEDSALPFANSAFDAILAQHLIEHIPDVDAALREWRRVLKPRGHLALATPNARYPDPAHFADSDHARVFDAGELRAVVERAGFVIEECTTIFPYLSRAGWLRGAGVVAYRAFQRVPYFAERGRTILVGARVSD